MTDFITEQTPLGASRQRRYDPARHIGHSDNPSSGMSMLVDDCLGDWAWKPYRDKRLGDKMRTFLGVPKGMPEQLGRARELAGEPGAVRYDS